jgi:hypothetical protein
VRIRSSPLRSRRTSVAEEIARHLPRLATKRGLDQALLFTALQVMPIGWKAAADYGRQHVLVRNDVGPFASRAHPAGVQRLPERWAHHDLAVADRGEQADDALPIVQAKVLAERDRGAAQVVQLAAGAMCWAQRKQVSPGLNQHHLYC